MRSFLASTVAAALVLAAPAALAGGARIVVIPEGAGFTDPTPAAPVAGNNGTTLGEQRLNVFKKAAELWASTLDSTVEIHVLARFVPLACTATSGVLGSARAFTFSRDFENAPYAATWHHSALANKLSGVDQVPEGNSDNLPPQDLLANFNSDLGKPGCLTSSGWYLGFDGNEGNGFDLLAVLLHEFGHGLGFSTFVNGGTGTSPDGYTDVYARNLLDLTIGKTWDVMTGPEIVASAVNTGNLVWIGPHVTAAVPSVLTGTPTVRVITAGGTTDYAAGTASYGPAVADADVTGLVKLADDGVAPGSDACTPLPPGSLAGRIGLADRGVCGFVIKSRNLQDAGAIGVVIADNVPGQVTDMSGVDPAIVIPSLRVTLDTGNALKAELSRGDVTVRLFADRTRLAGATKDHQMRMFAPNPRQPGSSTSHWDTSATPNLLMEPSINSNLTHSLRPPQDLTLPQMRDIGWYPDGDLDMFTDVTDQCLASDLRSTVVIGTCDSGVTNSFTKALGCTRSDRIQACVAQSDPGRRAECVARILIEEGRAGTLTPGDVAGVMRCMPHRTDEDDDERIASTP